MTYVQYTVQCSCDLQVLCLDIKQSNVIIILSNKILTPQFVEFRKLVEGREMVPFNQEMQQKNKCYTFSDAASIKVCLEMLNIK